MAQFTLKINKKHVVFQMPSFLHQQTGNMWKMISQRFQNRDFISGVAPLGAPLVARTAFGHQTFAPRAPKVPPMIEKSTKNDTKEPPD